MIYSFHPLSVRIFRRKSVYVLVAMGSRMRNRTDLQTHGDLNRNSMYKIGVFFSFLRLSRK
jgi:hypothetical protein